MDEARGALRLKEMAPGAVRAALASDQRLIVPVGTVLPLADDAPIPLGAATIIVERLADDLSAEFSVLRAPTVEYGVNPPDPGKGEPLPAGHVSLRKKTLHRMLNDMLATWELHGVNEFVLLTAHGYDPHQEALGTVSTASARVRVVDVFGVNLSDLVGCRRTGDDRGDVYRALLAYVAPDLTSGANGAVGTDDTSPASYGRALYEQIRARISERIFLAPAPAE